MKLISPCKSGRIDNVWHDLLKEVDSKLPIVIVTRLDDYVFNEELYKLGKYILVDGCEYGWDEKFNYGTHVFGRNTPIFYQFKGNEWQLFEGFVKSKKPEVYFKRELLDGDDSDYLRPINYPCWHEMPEPQTKEEFNKRPLLFNFIWGLSHEYRKDLHGKIWQQAGKHNYIVCDNASNLHLFLEKENHERKVLTQNVPYYARYSMEDVTSLNQLSKISISIGGAGRHCFRDSESPMASVMYRWEDKIKFSYDWVHNVNCIKSEQGKEIETIMEALNNPLLYDIYLAGVENCRKYYLPTYVKEYLEPLIKSV